MKAEHRPLFDIDVLRKRAGAKVFARGAAYHRDGQVEILAIKPGRVLAQVAGTEDYRTELLARIRDHLKQKGVDALIEMILDLVERDPALFRKLDTAAAATRGDDKTLGARLRIMIDSATRTGDFVDYRGAVGVS
jgi:hypothetical protein